MTNPSTPMPASTKSAIKIVFFTLFLDLIGFSIIFPLFPEIIDYYKTTEPNNFLLEGILNISHTIIAWGGTPQNTSNIVLFGGILGALYSFLQFLFAPFWGSLSDKIGRKPILLISVAGTALSYLIWFFSGSFTLLVISRILSGVMSGNISTATAVVGDVTTPENRSKGMAYIGIAFGLGFVLGPAFGGILSQINLVKIWPNLQNYGINPFSVPAFFALCLALGNLFFLIKNFKETLSKEQQTLSQQTFRSNNPIKLFKPLPIRNVNITNLAYFFYILIFAGMEFTLTFLAKDRLGYTSLDNGYMFIYIGLMLALVQGGVVRRSAHKIGEAKMSLIGLCCIAPGLIIIGQAHSSLTLYLGLTFLAIGSAMVIPCLTSLVSLYTPQEHQGKAIGIFRSLGSLGRVIGPLATALIYWRFGSVTAYVLGSIGLIIPIGLVVLLKKKVS